MTLNTSRTQMRLDVRWRVWKICLGLLVLAGISGCAQRRAFNLIQAASERNPAFEKRAYARLLVLAKTQDRAARTVLEDRACAKFKGADPDATIQASHAVISQAPSLQAGLEYAAEHRLDGILVFRIEGHDGPAGDTLFDLDRLEGVELIDVKTGKRAWICTANWPGEDPRNREEEAVILRALADRVMNQFTKDMLPKETVP